jgi:hypothetical protein
MDAGRLGASLLRIAALRGQIAVLSRGGERELALRLLREHAALDLDLGLTADSLRRAQQAAALAEAAGDPAASGEALLVLALAMATSRTRVREPSPASPVGACSRAPSWCAASPSAWPDDGPRRARHSIGRASSPPISLAPTSALPCSCSSAPSSSPRAQSTLPPPASGSHATRSGSRVDPRRPRASRCCRSSRSRVWRGGPTSRASRRRSRPTRQRKASSRSRRARADWKLTRAPRRATPRRRRSRASRPTSHGRWPKGRSVKSSCRARGCGSLDSHPSRRSGCVTSRRRSISP